MRAWTPPQASRKCRPSPSPVSGEIPTSPCVGLEAGQTYRQPHSDPPKRQSSKEVQSDTSSREISPSHSLGGQHLSSRATEEMKDEALACLRQAREHVLANFESYQDAFDALQAQWSNLGATLEEWMEAYESIGMPSSRSWELVFGLVVEWKHLHWDHKYKGPEMRVTVEKFASALEDARPCPDLRSFKARVLEKFGKGPKVGCGRVWGAALKGGIAGSTVWGADNRAASRGNRAQGGRPYTAVEQESVPPEASSAAQPGFGLRSRSSPAGRASGQRLGQLVPCWRRQGTTQPRTRTAVACQALRSLHPFLS